MKSKKILAGILSAAMVLSSASLVAFADEITAAPVDEDIVSTYAVTGDLKAAAFEFFANWDKGGEKGAADGATLHFINVPTTITSFKIELFSGNRLLSTTINAETIDTTESANQLTACIVYNGSEKFSGSWKTTVNSAYPKNKLPDTIQVTVNEGTPVVFNTADLGLVFEAPYTNFDNLAIEVSDKDEFNDAIANGTAEDTILLTDDITLDALFTLKSNLNLNGKTLTLANTSTTPNDVIGDITISNGTIVVPEGFSSSESVLRLNGYRAGKNVVTFDNVNINASDYSAACGIIGINGSSEAIIKGGSIAITGTNAFRDNAGAFDGIISGNIGNGFGKLTMNGTSISTADTYQIFYGLRDSEISNVTFNGNIAEYMFSRVSGTVKDSSFTYAEGSSETKAVTRGYADDTLTVLNTSINNIPTVSKNSQILLNNNSKIYLDEKTASCFAAEAVAKATPAEGYYFDSNDNTIKESKANFVDTASSSGVTVTLDDLRLNNDIDHNSDATYEVVVSNVSAEDKAAVKTITVADGQSLLAYDIKVVKTENGTKETVAVTNQKVTLTLPTPVTNVSELKIYHITKNAAGETEAQLIPTDTVSVSADGMTVTFIAPSFSAYAVVYNTTSVASDDITPNITVAFDPISGKQNEYNIVLKADANKKINGLLTADLTFELNANGADLAYEIEPAANINLVPAGENRYVFNYDGINAHNATGANITIGKVVFNGYCTDADFSVKDETTNIVNATKAENSIVENYTVAANTLNISNSKIEDLTLAPETKALTINVEFPQGINDNAVAYQDMQVRIVSANSDETIKLGSDNIALENNKYVVSKNLVKGTTYTVTVSGAGYRTAPYTFTMNDNKTLNFWNNVMDAAKPIETGNAASAKKVNFLAGELVKDGKINIYDLSAVVSYFGTQTVTTAESDYARYDLNRDGIVDSKDIAYVLAAFGY